MINLVLYIFLFSVYYVILFFGNAHGVNAFLYTVPFLAFSMIVLSKNKKIKNPCGLLFGIPIVLLSLSYLLFNSVFTELNVFVIPGLFILMYIYTIRPTYQLNELVLDGFRLAFNRLNPTFIGNYLNVVSNGIKKSIGIKAETRKKVISVLIVIPIVLIVLGLLITADMQFKSLFSFILDAFKGFDLAELIGRIFLMTVIFLFTGAFFNYLLFRYEKEEMPKKDSFKLELFTIQLLLIVLNTIYVVFDIIQIRSLFLHHVGDGIIYSEYARTGFFQLLFVSVLNIGILLLTKKSKENTFVKNLSSLLVFLTFIIICSSFYRMYLYDMAYGYTVLRLLVYVTLITETILLIPTVIYIYQSRVKILKYYLIIGVVVYTLLNVYSIDKIIAKNNINRYARTEKIDIEYLVSLSYDDIPELYDFYSSVEDDSLKNEIRTLICNRYSWVDKDTSVFEYNIGREKAYPLIEKLDCDSINREREYEFN